jgi:hypothetical protein
MQESVDTVKGDLPHYRAVQVEHEQADPSGTILRVSEKGGAERAYSPENRRPLWN